MFDTKTYFSLRLKEYDTRAAIADHTGIRYSYSDIDGISKSEFFEKLFRKVVLCPLTNDAECLALYFSLLCSGAIPILTNFEIDDKNYNRLKARYKPHAELVSLADAELTETYFEHNIFSRFTINVLNNEDNMYEIDSELSLMFATSGSTGSSKYVKISHKNIISNTEAIKTYLKIQQSDTVITTLPPSYTYGASVLHTHFVSGCLVVCTQASLFQNEFWQIMKDFGITTFNGVPFHYQMLHRLKFHRKSLPKLKNFTQAGGHLSEEIRQYLLDYCNSSAANFFVMYGQTEASPRISYADMKSLRLKPGTIGKGISGCILSLEDEQGRRINKPYETGELVVEGDNVFIGYAHSSQDLQCRDRINKRLHTGDLAYYDEDKFFYLVGRKNRFIKMSGRRMSLDDIQNMISEMGIENVCTGDDDLLKIGCVGISSEDEKMLLVSLMERLNLPKAAVHIFHIDKIEKTVSGKIAYSKNDKKMNVV